MTRRITPLVAVLGASTLGLAVALTAVLATAGDDDNNRSNGIMMTADMPGYAGMMGAMGSGDSDQMLERMREVLSDEHYAAMMQHLQDHRSGNPMPSNAGLDGMMHTMMDGMMGQVPGMMTSDGMMTPGARGMTPVPSATR